MNPTTITREQWLNNAVSELRPLFKTKGNPLPEKLRVTVGWPSSGGLKKGKRTIGQCWSPTASADGTTEIFSSPVMDNPLHIFGEDGCGVLPTLAHELVHAAVGTEAGHKGPFKTLARAIGLEGKLTATSAGAELLATLKGIADKLGKFPHATLDLTKCPVKKQTCRQIKCECGTCGYVVRTTRKWLEDVGAPHCPKHGAMTYESPDGDEESEGEDND